MTPSRLGYRLWQFKQAVAAKPSESDLAAAKEILSTKQVALFQQLQPSEQAHAVRVLTQLQKAGQTHPDLMRAALLHDVGKVKYPLRLWERTWVILAQRLFPRSAARWGYGRAGVFRNALIAKTQHAEWGAQLAKEYGCSPLAVSLIRRHEEKVMIHPDNEESKLLAALQAADDQN